jgi:hypothetical protein
MTIGDVEVLCQIVAHDEMFSSLGQPLLEPAVCEGRVGHPGRVAEHQRSHDSPPILVGQLPDQVL